MLRPAALVLNGRHPGHVGHVPGAVQGRDPEPEVAHDMQVLGFQGVEYGRQEGAVAVDDGHVRMGKRGLAGLDPGRRVRHRRATWLDVEYPGVRVRAADVYEDVRYPGKPAVVGLGPLERAVDVPGDQVRPTDRNVRGRRTVSHD